MWVSKLQTETCLSTTEYVSLSQESIADFPLVSMLEELNIALNIKIQKLVVKCIIFRENNGAIKLVKVMEIFPRTKHISLKYHFFCRFIGNIIGMRPIDNFLPITDTLTNPLP